MRQPVVVAALLMPCVLVGAACAPGAPAGQVVARVNGVDITRRDILVELAADGAPADIDTRSVTPALLDRIVTRTLLATEARQQAIDRSPEFLGRDRRSRDQILSDVLLQRQVGLLPPPSTADIAHYVAANRLRFDERRILTVDRIAVPGRLDPAAIARLPTADAVAAWLTRTQRRYDRSTVTLDSLTLAPGDAARLDMARDRPVVAPADTLTLIDQIVTSVPVPVAIPDRGRIAERLLYGDRARALADRMVKSLRARTQVEYQAGYGPPR